MKIVNLTQHKATTQQHNMGVFDMPANRLDALHALLTFSEIPDAATLRGRACCIAGLVTGAQYGEPKPLARTAMIGGAPYLMAPLEKELARHGIKAVYAFSMRDSIEQLQPDGSTKKTTVFNHIGFVEGGATEKMTSLVECQEAQNIVDSEPMVFCPICGGRTRYRGASSNNCNISGVWHNYENRACDNCDIAFYIDDTRELCQGTIEPRFGTPRKNAAIEQYFGSEQSV